MAQGILPTFNSNILLYTLWSETKHLKSMLQKYGSVKTGMLSQCKSKYSHTALNPSETLHLSGSSNFHSFVLAIIKFLSYGLHRKKTELSADKCYMLSVKHKWFWRLLYHSSLILHPPQGIRDLNWKEASSLILILQPQLILKYFCIKESSANPTTFSFPVNIWTAALGKYSAI